RPAVARVEGRACRLPALGDPAAGGARKLRPDPFASRARIRRRGDATRGGEMDWDRILRPLQVLLIAAGALFGLAPFLAPDTFASLTGFMGTDVFVYRLAGAATFGYGVGLAAGWRASWTELRIPIAATFA